MLTGSQASPFRPRGTDGSHDGSARTALVKILVIDDSASNRSLARAALEDAGYEVVLAAGGAEGLEAFRREQPACTIVDVRMPGIDGFGVCQGIRALPEGSAAPILFLTALRDIDTFERALGAGGDDFLTKPISPAELIVRVQAALKLKALRVELREHYELLRRQRDDLLRLQLQKERLMAFVVHDLKNPVNSMDLHAQLLLRGESLSPKARESAAQIRKEARQLTRMLLNLLDVAKADEGRISPRPANVDLEGLVEEVFAELAPSAQERDVGLRSVLDVKDLRADADLLRRTLTNLVENAIRYAPPQTVVTASVARSADGVELRVADCGAGVPRHLREKVFDAFVQVDAGERPVARGGRGLGLTFCRIAVEAQGGRIWVEDGEPGAVFCVRLPPGQACA